MHTPAAYINGQCLTTMVTTSRQSSGQDMGFGGLGMATSKSGDYSLEMHLKEWTQ